MLHQGYTLEKQAFPSFDDLETAQRRLVEALEAYRVSNAITASQLASDIGITRVGWWHWRKKPCRVPACKIDFLIHKFRLNAQQITGDRKMGTGVHFIGSTDFAERYNAAVKLDNIVGARQYMRAAALHIFDLLDSYGLNVDYILTNRGQYDSSSIQAAQIIVHVGLTKYLLELAPTKVLSYRLTRITNGVSSTVHDGMFSMVILKIITNFLIKEQKNKIKNDLKQSDKLDTLFKSAKDLSFY